MSAGDKVRVFVGTRKGGYVVESDRRRRRWKVSEPIQPGREVFHMAPDPRVPGRVYALVNSVFWGPMLLRSTNSGKRWSEIPPPLMPRSGERPPPNFDGTPSKDPVKNLWHLEPGPESEPKVVYIGIDPASLFRSDDAGASWTSMDGLNRHETREKWNPGAGGMCLHTILLDPTDPKRMYVGISAAGTFRSDDAGEHWRPVNQGVRVSFQPEKYPAYGQCVHDVVLDAGDPKTLYRQDHDGIYVSHDGMESWRRVGRPLGSDFGFAVVSPPTMPGTAFFAPLGTMGRTMADHRFEVWRWDDRGRSWHRTMKGKPYIGDFGMHREAFASDALDPAGLYLGTTTGELFFSPDGARSWQLVPYRFPAIHSVSAESPPARR